MESLTQQLKARALALGFDMVGIIPAVPSRNLNAYLGWVAAEYYGKMGYMARPDRIIRRQDLNVIVPGVQSIICVGMNYFTSRVPEAIASDPSRGRISNYAWQRDYHDVMTPRLKELAVWLRETAPATVKSRVYVDTGAILEKDHAETAGLGFTGKHTLLITPQHGSFHFLGELLTTLPLDYDEMNVPMPGCGSCTRCLTACPTNAFTQPYVLDARRCISYLTIELKDWIPRELRPLIGNWVYGCDICQEVCPFNRFAQPTGETAYYPSGNQESEIRDLGLSQEQSLISNLQSPPLLDLLKLDEAAFNERFANSPIKRIKRRRLVRNACVAAGNWGSETAVSALIPLLDDPEPTVRGHAAWALRQIGGGIAETAVAAALAKEQDPLVILEMSIS